jgi:hypothetical protein
MAMDDPAAPSSPVAHAAGPGQAARAILSTHLPAPDGRCAGCLAERGQWAPHPCTPVRWAAVAAGHDMTVRFLGACAHT